MSTTLEQLQYGFDRDSDRIWRQRATTQGWDNAYVYDSLSQVMGDNRGDLNLARNAIAGIPADGASWQYDETGNWHGYQTMANGAVVLTQERMHDKGNRLMQVSDAASMRTDRAGRMLETVPGPNGDWNSGFEITWDAWSRIVDVASVEGGAVTAVAAYGYDGLTRRITRYTNEENVTLHSYYNEEWRPLEERKDSETTASSSYLWGSRHRDDLLRRDRAVGGTTLNETRYVLMDYFSPASITDENGAVTERYQFSAFGLRSILNPDYTVRSSSECAMEFAFQGQFLDGESGLMNYGYRYYSPHLGRWTCKDPIEEEGGVNIYGYVKNDAINKVDKLGLVDCKPGEMKDPTCVDNARNALQANLANAQVDYDAAITIAKNAWNACDIRCRNAFLSASSACWVAAYINPAAGLLCEAAAGLVMIACLASCESDEQLAEDNAKVLKEAAREKAHNTYIAAIKSCPCVCKYG